MMSCPFESRNKEYVGAVHVDPKKPLRVKSMKFVIHNFAKRPEIRGNCFKTPCIEAHGVPWYLCIYPRGNVKSNESVEYVTCFLAANIAPEDADQTIEAKFKLSFGDLSLVNSSIRTFSAEHEWGRHDCFKREDILDPSKDYLVDGTLTFDVDIQIFVPAKCSWEPRDEHVASTSLLSRLWEQRTSDSSADVRFLVQGKELVCHKCILEKQEASPLFDIVEDSDNNVVEIKNVNSDHFEAVLCYMYTGKLSNDVFNDNLESSTTFLKVADRFGCSTLKLKVEFEITKNVLKPSNAADLFLFADAHSCALLKEACIELFRTSPAEVKESDAWATIKESRKLLIELVEDFMTTTPTSTVTQGSSINELDVSTLRKQLEHKRLNIDGSRETLVKRLKISTTNPITSTVGTTRWSIFNW